MPSGRVSQLALCLTLVLTVSPLQPLWAGTTTTAAKDPVMPRVRGMTPKMKALIDIGTKRSTTFRELVKRLNESDVIVFLDTHPNLPSGLDGRLVFLTSAGNTRYLHAQLTPGLNLEELISVAAHEMQHAVEVAMHPEVRDAATLGLLYQRIGIPGVVKNRYDTRAAQSTGRRVRAELG